MFGNKRRCKCPVVLKEPQTRGALVHNDAVRVKIPAILMAGKGKQEGHHAGCCKGEVQEMGVLYNGWNWGWEQCAIKVKDV